MAAVGDEYVDALLLRVDTNLPIKTGEPSTLALRNLFQTQECFVRLCTATAARHVYHISLVNGLVRILRQLLAEHSASIGQAAPEVEENYRQSVHYLLETVWKCVLNSPNSWQEPDEKAMAHSLFVECAKLLCHFSEKPFWTAEIDLIGKLVCELSRSFSSVLLFVQQLFVSEPAEPNEDPAASPLPSSTNDATNILIASFSLVQYFDLTFKHLNQLLRDFAERVKSSPPNRKFPFLMHLIICAPSFAVLLWRTVDLRTQEFVALHRLHERDDFFEPCSRIFESCTSALASDKSAKLGRQPLDKEKMRQQLWPLMMACVVFSPKLTAGNEDVANFIELLRTKLKRNHEYEFVAPILARFCSSIGRLSPECRRDDLAKQVSTELRQFLVETAKKSSRNMTQNLEDSCVQTLCICLNLAVAEPTIFKAEDLLQDMFSPAIVDPLQGYAGPTIVAIALKSLWTNLQDFRQVLSSTAGRRVATFFTQLTTHYLSNTGASSSSQSGGSGGSQSAYTSVVKVKSIKVASRADRPSFDDNHSPTTQSIVYFLELFISAPKLVVQGVEGDPPGLFHELISSICGILDRPMFKKCVRAIEQLTENLTWPPSSQTDGLSRLRMLSIPIDAFSKRMIHNNCSPAMLTDFVNALNLLSAKFLATLTFLRPESIGNDHALLKDTIQRFERALICRLWTTDTSTVIAILDCVANLCKIVDNICQGEDMVVLQFCPNLHSYAEMSNEMRRQSVSLGRVALQKHVLTSLRTLRYPSPSVIGAWECVFAQWVAKSKAVLMVLKSSVTPIITMTGESVVGSPVIGSGSPALPFVGGSGSEASTSPGFLSRTGSQSNQRRQSSIVPGGPVPSPSLDVPGLEAFGSVDELLVEWSHMTYFLAALADAYFKHRAFQRKSCAANSVQVVHLTVVPSISADTAIGKPGEDALSIYVSELLRMLVHTSEEKYGVRVERCVRESLGGDLRPPIQSIVIEEAHKLVTKCLDITNQVVVSEQNTLFVGNITLLFKMMLDKPSLSTRMDVQVSNTLEEMISLLSQYVRAVGTAKLHTNFCSLLLAVLRRREEMGYRLETKFRAKVVDYLLNFPQQTSLCNELVLLQLKTMSTVLARFPLIMDASGGNVDHSYRLRQLKMCAEFIVEKSGHLYRNLPSCSEVDEQTLQALLNLLLFNGDLGLSASLCLIMAPDARIRASYLDALSRFIRQGISNNNATPDEASGDEFAQLAELVTMLDDRGELPVVMALVEVVPAYQLPDLARLLTHLFDAKHLLSQLVINVLLRELSISPIDTVLRGSNLGSSTLSYSFQTFGSYYVAETIGPIAKRLMNFEDAGCYEVNPELLEGEVNIEEHRQNLRKLTSEVLNALVSSRQRFPAKLRSLCRCVHEVLAERFPQSDVLRLTGGTLVFLRFINPFLTSSFEFGLCDRPSKNVQRAFTLVAKLLQSAANGQPLKEEFMKPLNDFTSTLRKEIVEFVDYLINSDEGAASSPAASSLFLGESIRHSLHYFLYTNQERVADCLRERRLIARKPLDRLETLLNKLGPVELSFYLATYSSTPPSTSNRSNSAYGSQNLVTGDRLEPQLAEQVEKLRDAKIFYHSGTSAAGNPVFYLIPKHTRSLLSDFGDSFANAPGSEALATLIIALLKPFNDRLAKWELVVDLTQAPVGVMFKSDLLQKLSSIPEAVLANLATIYVYQCAPVVADFARLHDRFISYLRQNVGCRFIFPENLTELRQYVPQLKLPITTLALDDEAQLFNGATKMSRHKVVTMNIQTNKCAIKISTAERVRLFAGCLLFVVETFAPEDIEDIQLDLAKQQITLILRAEPVPVVFGHPQASEIFESLKSFREKVSAVQQTASRGGSAQDYNHAYHSRTFLTTRMTGTVPVRLRDISAFLLATGLANLSSGVPCVQGSALNLVASLCHRFDLTIEDDARLSNLLRITAASGSNGPVKFDKFFPPIWSSELVTRLSLRICQSAPWLLLDFVAACSYYLAAESQFGHVKAAICDCLSPWLDHLKTLRTSAEAQPCPLNDAVTSLVSAFIDLPSNAHLTSSVFPKLDQYFDVVLEAVCSLQTAIPPNDLPKRNNALVILLKTAKTDRILASRVLARYIEELMLVFPTRMSPNNHRLAFLVRVLNAFLAEDMFEVEGNGELLVHFSLSLVGSGAAINGEAIYSLLYNTTRSFAASFNDPQVHRSLAELTESKYTDLFVGSDYRNVPTTSGLAGEAWVSLLEYIVDLVAAVGKTTCCRWADLCRKIVDSALDFSINNPATGGGGGTSHHVAVLGPSVREAVRVLGFLSALPPANMVLNTVVGDVEKILGVFGRILSQQIVSPTSPEVSVGISGALSFFARVTSSIPASLIAILGDFFWLALAFLLSDEPTIYADALILVDAVIASLWARTSCPLETILSCFQRHGDVFSRNFAGILPAATSHGLDLRDHIHFVLARLLFKSIDHPDTAICSYASRLLLRLHQPNSNSSVFASQSESSRSRTIVYSLVAHILMPDHASRTSRRPTRGSSVASTSSAPPNGGGGSGTGSTSTTNSALNSSSCGCWDDRLSDIEKLDGDEKALCCEFLFALLLTSPKNLPPQQPILVSIARLFAASGSDPNRGVLLSSLTRLPEVKTRLADLLRTTHDPDTLIAAQNLLEHVAPQSMETSSLFASLHRIPIAFSSSNQQTSTPILPHASLSMPPIGAYYTYISNLIFEGCLRDCNLPSAL